MRVLATLKQGKTALGPAANLGRENSITAAGELLLFLFPILNILPLLLKGLHWKRVWTACVMALSPTTQTSAPRTVKKVDKSKLAKCKVKV